MRNCILMGCCALVLLLLVGCSHCSDTGPFPSSISLPNGIHLIAHQAPCPDSVTIPYVKYRLNNGLTVILSPDHSEPLVNVDVSYHVGSSRETPGRTGFAHFFEHMMFQGSQHVAAQQHMKMITQAGGRANGITGRDRTHYFETVPSNQLEKVLWLESDRMGFLLKSISPQALEIQRKTVNNERAQKYDNQPYGRLWQTMDAAMYPPSHPYSWPTMGYAQDLNKATVNDLKSFFLRWYSPNNAVLTIGGDINVRQTLQWIIQYFGSIPRGPQIYPLARPLVALPNDRFITVQERIKQPMVVVGWKTEYLGAESQTALDMLAMALSSGDNSILYQSLVKSGLAIKAGAFQRCGELSCSFYLYAIGGAHQQVGLKPIYHALLATLKSTDITGVSATRLAEVKGMAQANVIFSLQNVDNKVTQLARNEMFFEQPDRETQVLKNIESSSPAALKAVLEQFLLDEHKVVMSIVPRGHVTLAAGAANFILPTHRVASQHEEPPQGLTARHIVDHFDRATVPVASHPVKPTVPELYSDYWNNGIELMGTQTNTLPTTRIEISIPAGDRYVSEGKEGLAELTANALREGSTVVSPESMTSQLNQLGSSVTVRVNEDSTQIDVATLTTNVKQTMTLVKALLFHPAFSAPTFQRIKQQMIQGAVYQRQKLTWLADQATRKVLFDHTRFARDSQGTPHSLARLTLDDVKAFYSRYYTPKGTKIAIVGSLAKRDAEQQLAFLSGWHGDDAPLLAPQLFANVGPSTIYYVNKPGASQSIVRFVRRAMPFDATGERFLTVLTNFNLSGNFNSRLNQDLREAKGDTYGVDGQIVSRREVGAIILSAAVKTAVTGAAIRDIRQQMARFSRDGLTHQEMRFMRLAVGQQDALAYETQAQKAGLIERIMAYSLDKDYLSQCNDIVARVPKSVLDHLARKWFDPENYQIIVVGDMKKVKPQLDPLGWPLHALEVVH